MKKSTNRFIRICTPVLCLLLLLPSFSLWAVAETQSTENGMSSQALESAEALDLQRAELVSELDGESLIFNYVDRASFIEAGHVERVYEDEEPNTYVFKNADGSKTVYFLDEDVKYVNAGGEATEKKLDLVALDGGYTTRASNVSLALPNAIANGVTLAYNGNSVTLTPKPRTLTGGTVSAGSALTANGTASAGMGTGVGMTADLEAALMEQALQIAPVGIASGKADYQNVFGTGTTLRYTPTLSGVKEDVILDAYRGQNTFAFTLNTGNLSVFEEEGRYFIAPTADAEEKILISDTWVYDAAGNFEKGTLTVTPVKAGLYLLTVGASVDFLTDENTVYPVYIDPTLTINSGTNYIEDAGIYSGKPTTNYGSANYFDVGTYSSTLGVGRAVVRLNGLLSLSTYQDLHGELIDEVQYCVFNRMGYEGTVLNIHPLLNESWSAGEVTWNTVGGYGNAISREETTGSNTMMSLDITDLVYDWKTESAGYPARPEAGFILISSDETVRNRFYSAEVPSTTSKPYVTITYSEGVKILHPDQPYREVAENEIVYVGQGTSVQFEAAQYPLLDILSWSIDDADVAMVDDLGQLYALTCGTVTLTATLLMHTGETRTDTVEVEVIPLLSGEYYLESKQLYEFVYANRFYEERRFLHFDGDDLCMRTEYYGSKVIVQYYAPGYYTIYVKDAGGYLAAPAASTGEVTIATTLSTRARWFIEITSSGGYTIESYYHRELYLQNSNDSYTAGVELSAYTNDSTFTDEWIFHSGVFTIVNYYDSAFDDIEGNLEYIEAAGEFVEEAFKKLFNIDVAVKNEPILYQNLIYQQCPLGMDEQCNEDCGDCEKIGVSESFSSIDSHHKHIGSIANQIMKDDIEFNHIYVLWGDYDPSVFCYGENPNTGEHLTLSSETVAGTYNVGHQFVQVFKILHGNTEEETKQLMSIALFHEIFHVFGLSEQYTGYDHTVGDRPCVMSTAADLEEVSDLNTGQTKLEKLIENVRTTTEYTTNNESLALCNHCLGSFRELDLELIRFLDGEGW